MYLIKVVFLASFANAAPQPAPRYLWAQGDQLTVLVTGNPLFSNDAEKLHDALVKKSPPSKRPPPNFKVEPADYPPFLKTMKTMKLLTPKGVEDAKIKAVTSNEGCSAAQLEITTSVKSDTRGALALIDADFPKGATFRPAGSKLAKDTPLAPHVKAIFDAAAKKSLDAPKLAIVAKEKIGTETLHAAPGKFAKGATWVVWAEFSGGSETDTSFSLALLVDAKGKIVATIEAAAVGQGDGLHGWKPEFVGDVDADGLDDVVANVSYYEGAGMHLLLDGGVRAGITLYEDGC